MIEFKDVSFTYNNSEIEILKNINFKLNKGEWLTILGENGSGKSTLTKLIYGQFVASKGEIFLNNKIYSKDILGDIREKIAVVFQNPDNQFVGSTVAEDIAFGLENRNVPQEKMEKIIDEVLDVVDMSKYRKYEPSSLSGGQKQRVALASSLALNPEILILDEATSMLDPKARKNILKYIKKINTEKKMTIISITHDAEESIYSDKILILNKGKVVYTGNYAQLYNNFDILEKYNLEIPFFEKFKRDLNSISDENFTMLDDEKSVLDKLCKLALKM